MTPVRCLQLDVGNSGGKWRLLEDEAVLARGRLVPGDAQQRREFLDCSDSLDAVWIASVASEEADQQLAAMLRERWDLEPWFARTPARTGDLENSYREPHRMGVDRWLAMLAARACCSQRLCVVDVGSALTIDIVAADGRHEGGYIIPGPELMERALLRDTQRVRYADSEAVSLAPGTDTGSAVGNGIALAQCGAVELALQRLEAEGPLELFLAGGGAQFMARFLERQVRIREDLVFEGLALLRGATGDV